jgi:hypothetical protein
MPIQVKTGDVFLLCSDGLNGMVNDKGIEMMLQGNNLQQAGDDLIRAALDAGGNDNVTATIVAIDESVYSKSNFVDFNPVKKFDGASTQTYSAAPAPTKSAGGGIFSAKGIALIGTVVVLLGVIGYFLLTGNESQEGTLGADKKEMDSPNTSLPTVKDDKGGDDKPKTKAAEKPKTKVEDPKTQKPKEGEKPKVEVGNSATMKQHKVEKKQNLQNVLAICKVNCPNLTLEKIKSANSNLNKDVKNQVESETEFIKVGTKLYIPCD